MSATTTNGNRAIAVGAVLAGVGVALGAFGAHGLRTILSPAELGWWQTAVQYQVWHGLALVAIGAAGKRALVGAACLIAIGTSIFSASLYLLALTNLRWLGAITPVGGLGMISGWALLAWRTWRG